MQIVSPSLLDVICQIQTVALLHARLSAGKLLRVVVQMATFAVHHTQQQHACSCANSWIAS